MSGRKMSLKEAFRLIYTEKGKAVFADAKFLKSLLEDLLSDDKNLIPFIVQSSTAHYFDYLANCPDERIRLAVEDAVNRISADYQDAISLKIEEALYYAFSLSDPPGANRGKKNKEAKQLQGRKQMVSTAEQTVSASRNSRTGIYVIAAVTIALIIATGIFLIRPWKPVGPVVVPNTGLEAMPGNNGGESEIAPLEETETPEAAVSARVDLTRLIGDIDELHHELQGIQRKDSGEYDTWYQDLDDQFGYGNYTGSSAVDTLWFISGDYELYGLYVGEQVDEGISALNDKQWVLDEASGYNYVMEKGDMTLSLTADSAKQISQIQLQRSETDISETAAEQTTAAVSTPEPEETKEPEAKKNEQSLDDSYFFPESLDVLLSESQLAGMSARDLTLARNEIFARYGYTFKRQDLQEYFNTKSWYHADPAVNPDTISGICGKIGMQNMVMIREYQKRNGLTY